MTDKQIIKALECCLDAVDEGDTKTFDFLNAVIDLSNRQKAEIEGLKKELNKYPIKTVVNNNCEIHSKTSKDYDNLMADIKSEAIKEFAERLKERRGLNQMYISIVSKDEIDNLVKEMTEANKNER